MKKIYSHILLLLLLIACMALLSCTEDYWDRLQVGETAAIPEGIFVNKAVGDDLTGTGAYDKPFATIGKGILVATPTQAVHVAAGIYNEAVTLSPEISLYGGYNSSDWTDRRFDTAARSNPTYRTAINNTAGNGLTANDPLIDTFTVVEGFVIQSANADGIQIDFGASPTIRENTIKPGTGANINGIEVNGSSPTIVNNLIYVESGTTSKIGINLFACPGGGIWANDIQLLNAANNSWGIVNDSSNNTVAWNSISAGSSSVNSFGIWNNNCSPTTTISYNTIDGGTGPDTRGIRNDSSPVTILGNWIHGGVSTGTSYGISNSSSNARIFNNAIYGGNGGTGAYGIWNNASNAEIYNNTIDGGNSPFLMACISINNCAPRISNNIIHISGAGITTYGIFEMIAAADPAELRNNDIYNCLTALYHDADVPPFDLTVISDVNDFNQTTQGPPASAMNNVLVPLTLNAYGRITAGFPPLVTGGGLDGVAEGWGFNTDRDNRTRTPFWSMGAYEYD